MISRICKRNFFAPTIWSHSRSINVIGKGTTIRYEIPMYNEDEMEAKLVSVYKSNRANTIVVEFCIDNVEQDASPAETKMPELS
jgi:hypothetical protein